MFNKIIVVCMFALVAIFTLIPEVMAKEAAITNLWFNKVDLVDGEVILQPGEMTFCDKDFIVENKSSGPGEIGTIVGNETIYTFDRMASGTSKAYSLQPVMPEGGVSRKGSLIDEAQIVNSAAASNSMHVTCK